MVEEYFGKPLEPFQPLPEFKYEDFLGWNEQGDGNFSWASRLTMVESRMKAPSNENGSAGNCAVWHPHPADTTPQRNFYDIEPNSRLFKRFLIAAVQTDQVRSTRWYGIQWLACHAHLRVSITESERVMPSVLKRIEVLLDKVGLEQEHFVVR